MDKETGPDGARETGDPGTLDPLELALEGATADPTPDSPARRVLLKHERLIEAQTAQLGRQRWRDFIITALGVCLLAMGGVLVWDAARADGVVVEPFATPPDMAERGLSGPVLATQMLDRLTAMQAETVSLRAASTYANDWDGDIAVEIPSTGVSIGELRRYLRDWLGRQTRLSGEVFRLTDGRIAVTTRVGANPGTRFEGTEAELDALLQQGAEAIFAETQPYRYAVWLNRQGRGEEGDAVRRALVAGTDENDRLWGYVGLANSSDELADIRRYHETALSLRPDFVPALSNLGISLSNFGLEEQSYRRYGEVLDSARAARRQIMPERVDWLLNDARTVRMAYVGDMQGAAELAEEGIGLPDAEFSDLPVRLTAIQFRASAHDLAGARRVLEESGLTEVEARAALVEILGPGAEFDSALAFAIEDWTTARDVLAAVLAAFPDYERNRLQLDGSSFTRAGLAVVYAYLGQIDEARATIAPTALNCAHCVRARGTVEAFAGNPDGADHWLSESVRITPSLPTAHNDWAEAYLVRRDPARAIEQARLAVRKGPKWAEPRKFWGDALMMQGRPAEAARKYREAVRLAPGWGSLHLALGRAQAAAGQDRAARESFRTAAGLELNPIDRAAVTRLTAGAAG